jgi:chloramphenicol O-acetyltransferase type A
VEYIDLDSWERREHFLWYINAEFPYITITADIDVTSLISYCRSRSLSSYITFVFAAHRIANGIENFRYRINDKRPIINETTTPTFTHIPDGSEMFVEITVPFSDDLNTYHRMAKERIQAQGTDSGFANLKGRYDLILYSGVPWLQYTHLTRPIARLGVDTNPKISWGKYFGRGDRVLMPFTVQVHHGLMDGIHIGRYYEQLQRFIDEL